MPKIGNQNAVVWTPEEVAQVTKLWVEDGLSYGEIGKVMGKTRNAVLSKINRLKLPPRIHARVTKKTEAKPHGQKGQPKVNAIVAATRARIAPPPEPFDAETDIGIDVTRRVGIMDLTSHTCHWPVGADTGAKQMFCGCRKGRDAGPYCMEHTAKAEYRR